MSADTYADRYQLIRTLPLHYLLLPLDTRKCEKIPSDADCCAYVLIRSGSDCDVCNRFASRVIR